MFNLRGGPPSLEECNDSAVFVSSDHACGPPFGNFVCFTMFKHRSIDCVWRRDVQYLIEESIHYCLKLTYGYCITTVSLDSQSHV